MTSLATAFITIRPDTSGFGARLSSSVNADASKAGTDAGKSMTSKFGSALKIGALIGGAFAVTKGVTFFKDMLAEADEARKVGAQTAAVLKSTGGAANVSAGQVAKLAGALSAKTGIDDEAIQSGQNLLLTFKNVRNETGEGNKIFDQATGVMLDMSAALGQDMKSSSIQLGKALNDPVKGITALSRVGVTFTEGQKKTITRMTETGNVMGAQKLILRELNSEFRGSAEAQATPAEKARVAWDNLKETLGTAVLPMVDRLATFFSEKVVPAISKFVAEVKSGEGAGGRFADKMKEIGAAVKSAGEFLFDNRKAVAVLAGAFLAGKVAMVAFKAAQQVSLFWLKLHTAGTIQHTVVSKAARVGTLLWAGAQRVLNAVLRANPIGIIITVLAALAAAFVVAYKKSDTFRAIVDKAWAGVKKAASVTWNWLKDMWVSFKAAIVDAGDKMSAFWRIVKDAWGRVKDAFSSAFKAVKDLLVKAIQTYVGFWKGLFDKLKSAASTGWDNIKTNFSNMAGKIRDIVSSLVGKVRDIWGGLKEAFAGPVNWIISNVINKLIGAVNKVAGALGKGNILSPLGTIGGGGGFDAFGLAANAARGSSRALYATGGWTGPGQKMKPAGIVHADEHVWTKDEMQRFPGGHKAMEKMRESVLHGALKRLPGFWLGGGVKPAAGAVSQHSGYEWTQWAGDINEPGDSDIGHPVKAWKAGTISSAGWGGGDSYGNYITMNHAGGLRTLYAHLNSFVASAGQQVSAGQLIGRKGGTGNVTGPHLHFELAGGSNPITTGDSTSRSGRTGVIKAIDWGEMLSDLLAAVMPGGVPGGRIGQALASGVFDKLKSVASGWAGKFASGVFDKLKSVASGWAGKFDGGGIATGSGYLAKQTLRPERVLSPRQTDSFERLVAALEQRSTSAAMAVIKVYDVDGQLMGTMRGEIDDDRSYRNTLSRQGVR